MKTTDSPFSPPPDDFDAKRSCRTRRAFLTAFVAAGAGWGSWHWLRTRPAADGIAWPLRRALQFNEKLSNGIFDPSRRMIELPVTAITPNGPRANGDIGLNSPLNLPQWRLRVSGTLLALRLDDLHVLPQVTQITPLNYIEGWTTVARWTGVRFADFVDHFCPQHRSRKFVALSTPGDQYYVGLDAASAFHSQTLLCYAINNEPLTTSHGAPLRLLIPTKYGIKNLKRIGNIRFSDERPLDYWAEQGYDWFAGF